MQMMFALVHTLFANKAALAMQNLALRQQLAVYKRKQPRPRLTDLDRAFGTVLKEQFDAWADALIIVKLVARPILNGLHRDYRLVA